MFGIYRFMINIGVAEFHRCCRFATCCGWTKLILRRWIFGFFFFSFSCLTTTINLELINLGAAANFNKITLLTCLLLLAHIMYQKIKQVCYPPTDN